MAVLEQFDPATARTEPVVWVSRIALFESLDPLKMIREPIEFTTGLNVVWGIENESNDQHFEPGHGVGKTTLCRLIRYCLGESNYGQAHAAKEILHTFTDGYVAAEIRIQGHTWAVLRPFNKTRADYAQADATIEELIAKHPPRSSFNEYLDRLSSVCLADLRTDSVLIGGASVEWRHLLAMCTRDQEARYQSLWQWRSPRSDSGPPKIQKEDAFLTLRSVLGMLPDEETKLQREIALIEEEGSTVEKRIVERRREPEYWIRHYRTSLQQKFGIADALVASLDSEDMFSLPKLVEGRIAQLEVDQAERRKQLATLDRRIQLAAVALQEPAELQAQDKTSAEVTDAGTDTLLSSLEELRQLRQIIKDAELSLCKYGQVSIGNCSHAQQQLVELDAQIRDASESAVPASARRDQIAASLRERVQRRSELLTRLRQELQGLNAERRELDDKRQNVDRMITSARTAFEKLAAWENLRSGISKDSELAELISRKEELGTNLTNSKKQLDDLLSKQDVRLAGLRQVYESLVRTTLSADFKGRIQLTQEGLTFRVFRGENLSGEAFETLSILLADIAILIMGALRQATHPGLLVHDSPREADLGGQIYRRLLVCIADIARELGSNSTVPFQHIVTTTTPPPTGLRGKNVTRLKLGDENGQLFGKQLHAGPDATQADLPLDDGSSGDERTG